MYIINYDYSHQEFDACLHNNKYLPKLLSSLVLKVDSNVKLYIDTWFSGVVFFNILWTNN